MTKLPVKTKANTGQHRVHMLTTYRKKLNLVYKQRKIKNASSHINRLFKSKYPGQINDYVMLKLASQDVPIDAELGPVVKALVARGFKTCGVDISNQANIHSNNFILVTPMASASRNDLISQLQKTFEACRTKVIRVIPRKKVQPRPNMLVIAATGKDCVALLFQTSYIDAMQKALHVSPNLQKLPAYSSTGLSNDFYNKITFPRSQWTEKERLRYQEALKRIDLMQHSCAEDAKS